MASMVIEEFAFHTCSKKRNKKHNYVRNLWFPRNSPVCLQKQSLPYFDFAMRNSSTVAATRTLCV